MGQVDARSRVLSTNRAAIGAATRMLKAHMHNLAIPGMQIAVSIKGKPIWSESFGYADLEKKILVSSSTSFRIGSVSKSLTGAAIGLLYQRGALDWDAQVSAYVPSFPQKRWPITVRQIAGHISGLRHYSTTDEASSRKHYTSVLQSLEQFEDDPLLFEPGTQFEYSSYGYVLLSAVIEAVSKRPFTEFMMKEVFSPLHMEHTTMDFPDTDIPARSRFYSLDDSDKRVEAPFVDNSGKWAAGGMVSTANDLIKFGDALLHDSFLHSDVVATLTTPMKTSRGEDTRSCIGWEIRHDEANRRVIVNDGSLPSARAVLAIYPKEQLVIAVLANTGTGIFFNRDEAFMLADLFLDPEGLSPSKQELTAAVGEYAYSTFFDEDSINGTIKITLQKGQLQGSMTIPNRFFKDRSVSIPVVAVSGSTIHLLGTPGNWISVNLNLSQPTIKGEWRFGPLRGSLVGLRK